MCPAKNSADISTFLLVASVVVCIRDGWMCCLPLGGCAIDGSLCKICSGPSIFVLLVSLGVPFFLCCASPRGGVEIVLLLVDRSLLLPYVMVDVFYFSCRWLLRRACTGGYVPRVDKISSMVYIRDNEQTNNRIMLRALCFKVCLRSHGLVIVQLRLEYANLC